MVGILLPLKQWFQKSLRDVMLTKKKWALFSLLTLCGGTIYKLPSLKDAFYIPMQEYFHLTNGQIGNAMSVNPFVTTVGFFLSIYFADKLPRRYTMSFHSLRQDWLAKFIWRQCRGIGASSLSGRYLALLATWWTGRSCSSRWVDWAIANNKVGCLASSKQGVALSIPWWHFLRWQYLPGLAVAYWVLKQASGSIPFTVIAVGIIIFFVLNDKEEAPSVEVKKEDGARKLVWPRCWETKPSGLSLLTSSSVYAVYCGLTFFIPFLKKHLSIARCAGGAYGIINQYCLKMIGGPIGGMISDKILKSPSKYLCYTFIISTAALVLLIALPHESMPVHLGRHVRWALCDSLYTASRIFCTYRRSKIAENKTGAAMALGSFYWLRSGDVLLQSVWLHSGFKSGIIGYKIVFGIMACFAFCGAVVSVMLVKRISQRKKEMLAAEAWLMAGCA